MIYDNIGYNRQLVLDLPFREGIGIITQDVAKPHHPVDLKNTPTWTSLDSGLGVVTFDGTTEYAESDATVTGDLDFTTGDYSLGVWLNIEDSTISQIIMGRYELNVSGWELYWTHIPPLRYMTLRHHHAGGTATRSACYSLGWTEGSWVFCGISRTGGGDQKHYRNGAEIDVVGNDALEDPETETADLVIGARYTKNTNFYKGGMWGLRIWDRVVTADEWMIMYELEKGWFS